MSKVQFLPVTDPKSEVPAGHVRKTYKYFDLDVFGKKTDTVDIPFTPYTEIPELSKEELLTAVNAYAKAQVLAEAEAQVASKGGRTSVVMAIAKPFRAMPPFSQIFKKDSAGAVVVDSEGNKVVDRQKQTEAILKMVKANPEMLEAIKSASASTEDESADQDEE